MSTLDISASISSNVQVSTREWMRSRALMGKWCIHLGQTFSFSSNSLSKIIVLHLGHFVHRPSGMSRFLDFDFAGPSFGLGSGGTFSEGGVSAGSTISLPPNFFRKTVVPISLWIL